MSGAGRKAARPAARPPARGAGGGRPAARRGREGPPSAADPLDDLRRRIDALDRQVVGLLNDRAGCAIALGKIKKDRGLPIYQPAREEEVLQNVEGSNGGPLEAAALRRLFERIIDESRRIERLATAGEAALAAPPAPGGGEASD